MGQSRHCALCVLALLLSGACSSQQSGPNNNRNPEPARAALISGSAFQVDATGDVFDDDGRKARELLPGVDLVAAKIEARGSDLAITLTASNDFPSTGPPGQAAVWHFYACTPDGENCCFLGARLEGSRWKAFLFEMSGSRNTDLDSPAIRGKELTITVSQSLVPAWMRSRFKWWAVSEWGNLRWSDRVPDEGKDKRNPATLPFPSEAR